MSLIRFDGEHQITSAAQALECLRRALMSEKPSVHFTAMRQAGQLCPWFQELADLIGVEQSPVHHAEGDVWTHTMMVLDEAVVYKEKAQDPLGFMMGALTHDFGKAVCTELIDGQIHAYEHEIRGLPLAEAFLERLGVEESRRAYVCNLIRYHMQPNALTAQGASVKAMNRMFDKALDPMALVCLATADGRGKLSTLPYVSYEESLLESLQVYYDYLARPHVEQADLAQAGVAEGEPMEQCLAWARKLQLAGVDQKNQLTQTLSFARQAGFLPPLPKKKRRKKKKQDTVN